MKRKAAVATYDLRFLCDGAPMRPMSVAIRPVGGLQINVAVAQANRTTNGGLATHEDTCLLVVNLAGTLLVRGPGEKRISVMSPFSIGLVRPETEIVVQAAKGFHEVHLISWNLKGTPILDEWLVEEAGSSLREGRVVSCMPIAPRFADFVAHLKDEVMGDSPYREAALFGLILQICSVLLSERDSMRLTAVPVEAPGPILELINTVRRNPTQAWPLKDAAAKLGYSTFHFSRVFKQIVGVGFHEFVDRCRTEAAVDLLVTTDHQVDVIASTSGFSTAQGLRNSIKEYMGLSPSELRNVPDSLPPDFFSPVRK